MRKGRLPAVLRAPARLNWTTSCSIGSKRAVLVETRCARIHQVRSYRQFASSARQKFSTTTLNFNEAPSVLEALEERTLLAQASRGLREHLQKNRATCYLGIDPSASSLHLGNLLAIISLIHLQLAGHGAIFLVGGATGAIGDPSGRSSERQALSHDALDTNISSITKQLTTICQHGVKFAASRTGATNISSRIEFLNNKDWIGTMSLLDFLSGPGKRARVSTMLARESVKNRLNSSSGISFTEFSYQLLQGLDFLHLYKHKGCTIQLGGSDQWGNIQSGIDMIRRDNFTEEEFSKALADEGDQNASTTAPSPAYGLTIPLLTTSTGVKFGKSAGNAIWLDPQLTSPFELYQFLLNSADADVPCYLKMLTFLPLPQIDTLLVEHAERPDLRKAQTLLAQEVTELVHGEGGLRAAQRATAITFGGVSIPSLSATEVLEAFNKKQKMRLKVNDFVDSSLVNVLAKTDLVPSKSQARQLILSGGVSVNDVKRADPYYKLGKDDLLDGKVAIVKAGKLKLKIVEVE